MSLNELKDFKTTPYYKYYTEMVDEYCKLIVDRIMSQQWIDFDKKYSWNDVLREVYKFVNNDLREFKDLDLINPSTKELEDEKERKLIEESINGTLGIRTDM